MCNLETEELKFMKRKAETLIEVVVAMAVFGVMMSGLSEFIAEQTRNVARLIDKDALLYMAQRYQQEGNISPDNTITVTRGAETMTFNLNPSN